MNEYPEMHRAFDRIQAAAERIRDLQTPEYREPTLSEAIDRTDRIHDAMKRRLLDAVWVCENFAEMPENYIKRVGELAFEGSQNNEKIGAIVHGYLVYLATKAATKEVDGAAQ